MVALLDDKAIIARIRQLRQVHSGDRGKALFAKALGLSPSTYNYYEKDRLPPIDVLWTICRATGADVQWLLTGEPAASVGREEIPSTLRDKIVQCIQEDPKAGVVIDAFLALLMQKTAMEKQTSSDTDSGTTSDSAWLPILGRTAAGFIQFWQDDGGKLPGITELSQLIERHQQSAHKRLQAAGIRPEPAQPNLPEITDSSVIMIQLTEANDEGVCEFIECAEMAQRVPGAFGLRVDGESMAPRICDGDIVILHPDLPAQDGTTAVIKLRDQIGSSCKILRFDDDQVHLVAMHEGYEPKVYRQDQILWALRVLWRIRLS
jgi:SOS-response transcriptional repressor LexA/DNA-binding XRE family transcriptional regulator